MAVSHGSSTGGSNKSAARDDCPYCSAVGCSRAYAMLRELHTGWTTVRVLEQLATELPQMLRDKQFRFVPVAVGVAAERLTRSDLARVAADALRPWSGQAIGMWPVDLILGMADSWIERFEAV